MTWFWFYLAAAEYVMIAIFIRNVAEIDKHWPTDKWQSFGAHVSIFLWPLVFLYVIGWVLWRVSLKLVSSLRSEKR